MTNKEPITFISACAIERDYVYIAAKPDVIDSEDSFTRLFFFDQQHAATPWLHHDLPDWAVVSTCVLPKSTSSRRMYCALSEQGDVEITWPGGRSVEAIEGAGLRSMAQPIYGYVKAIREIDGSLYVCGSGGQVYKRVENRWTHIAETLKAPATAAQPGAATIDKDFGKHEFSDIDGYSSSDIYVVGGDGDIFHFDGTDWDRCDTPNDEILTAVACGSGGEVWVCGFNGTLLRGNFAEGFKECSRYDDNMIFSSIALFNETPYLASGEGLFFFNKEQQKISKVSTRLRPEIVDANAVVANDGVLWSFGYKDLAYFDGSSWTRVDHPDNPSIR